MSLILHAASSAARRATCATRRATCSGVALRLVHQHANPHKVQSEPNGRVNAHPATEARSTSAKRLYPWRFATRKASPTTTPQGPSPIDQWPIEGLESKSKLEPTRLDTSSDPKYLYQEDVFDESSVGALGDVDVIDDPRPPEQQLNRADHVRTALDEPTFGRGETRRMASKTVLNGGMTQKEKAARKNELETIALRQGVSAAQAETKRLKREDATRRQRRKAHLLRIQPYLERNLRLVDLEADEDQKVIEEQQSWTDDRLMREGIMLNKLEGYWLQNTFSSFTADEGLNANAQASSAKRGAASIRVAVFNKPGKAKLGWTRIQKGDQVALRPDEPKKETESTADSWDDVHVATVRSINEYEVRLVFRDPPAHLDLLALPAWRVDIAYNDTIEERLRNAVESVAHDVEATRKDGAELSGTYLVDVLLDAGRKDKPPHEAQAPIAEWIARHRPGRSQPNLDSLTDSQRDAVHLMLNERVSLIQGPPGTGKTSTIVAAIKVLKQHYEIPHPILLTSHTNVAVDNLAQGCKETGLHVVRAGPAARVRESIMDITLEGRMDAHPLKKRLDDVESIRVATMQSLHNAYSGRKADETRSLRALQKASDEAQDEMHGLSFSELNDSSFAAGSSRSTTSFQQKEPLSISALQKRLSRMNQQAFLLRRKMEVDIFAEADVVCCTALSVPLIRSIDFPLVFFDEATMATEPITLATIVKGCQQLCLIGDQKQLSPLIRSREALQEGIGESMFERLMDRGDLRTVMLDTQHRMHPSLAAFSGKEFYEGRLRDGKDTHSMSPLASAFVPLKKKAAEEPGFLTFVHHGGREHLAKSKSLVNQSEAELVVSIVADLLVQNPDLHGSDIAIITPYAGQRQLLARSMMEPGSPLRRHFARQLEKRGGAEAKARVRELNKLEIETIDGFEGREKRAIVFSMVRNNAGRHWGFLNEHKRWNVALTRARNGLWIVGSMPMMERKSIRELSEERKSSSTAELKDADEEDGVKEVLTRTTTLWRPETGDHAGFITRFAQHLRQHGCVVDAANVV